MSSTAYIGVLKEYFSAVLIQFNIQLAFVEHDRVNNEAQPVPKTSYMFQKKERWSTRSIFQILRYTVHG